jgi:hypothetical protein
MYLWAAKTQATRGKHDVAAVNLAKTRDLVSSIAGQPFWAWASVAGDPLGTMYMSTRVDSFEHYLTVNQAVNQSTEFHAQTAASAPTFDGLTETALGAVAMVAGELSEDPRPLQVVTTIMTAPGKQGDAMAWSTDMVNVVGAESSTATILTSATVGRIGEITFISGFDTPAQIDEFTARLMANADYGKMLTTSTDLFVPGSTHRFIMAKLP